MTMQKHNEEKLNEAFAQKCGVYLIFSVNMSGHFQGYARMMSYVSRQQVCVHCWWGQLLMLTELEQRLCMQDFAVRGKAACSCC
jgi:hypothetical protein